MQIIKRRKTCIVCGKDLPKITKRGNKRKRILTCSPECSKTFVRIRIRITSPYIAKIRKLEKRLKNE